MHPELINAEFFGYAIRISSYRFFMALAIAIAITGSYLLIKRSELDRRKAITVLIVSILGFLLGARFLNILINLGLYVDHPSRIFSLNATGFSEYGGLIGAAFAGWLAARKIKMDIWRLGDIFAPNLGLGIAIMRIGCFLNGCCFGKVTTLPWGVRFPLFSDAHMYELSNSLTGPLNVLPVHPTEIYELIAALIGSIVSLYIMKKNLRPGIAILAFIIWFTAFRLFNHFLRIMPPSFDAPIWFYPMLYLAIIATSCLILFRKIRKKSLK